MVLSLARYRLARVLRHGAGSLVALTLLMGAIGGVALASLVAARETSSSYSTLLARSNPSDLNVLFYGPDVTSRLAHLPGVVDVKPLLYSLNAFPMANGGPQFPRAYRLGRVGPLASVNGEYFTQDRVSVTSGRMADPRRADEFMATAEAERELGWHVGQRIPMGIFTNAQVNSAQFSTPAVRPVKQYDERLVGTIVFNWNVVRDEVDRYPAWFVFTPAAAHGLDGGTQWVEYCLQLRHGSASVSAVEREIVGAMPPRTTYSFHVTSVVAGQVERSVRPLALALGVFGAMALLGAILTAVQLIARQLRARR
ncbi:MAG: hypothetical protein KGJ36_07705, partial [Acidobacteriota bacterium]|nr:hypothetical protein [Acidobacteriota bacterium]